MKEINLVSLLQAYKNMDKPIYAKYLKYIKINPKDHELDDLESLVEELLYIDDSQKLCNRFYFGYTIP